MTSNLTCIEGGNRLLQCIRIQLLPKVSILIDRSGTTCFPLKLDYSPVLKIFVVKSLRRVVVVFCRGEGGVGDDGEVG